METCRSCWHYVPESRIGVANRCEHQPDQTAEMVALAYVSGDSVLLKLLTEPDDCFAIVKPEEVPNGIDPADCVVRIKFPDYVTKPNDKDKYIMTYASDGVIHAKFTEDQLLRDENGNIVSPKFDSH